MTELEQAARAAIRDVPDFPKPGIVFKDITPLLGDITLYERVGRWMGDAFADASIDRVIAMESRGFLFAPYAAAALGVGVALARKPGKLPWKRVSESYALEYGEATLEVHQDAVRAGERVLVVDDVLATGGTAEATVALVRRLGADPVGCVFLAELGFLNGQARLDVPCRSLITY